jgi:hypothetical protein
MASLPVDGRRRRRSKAAAAALAVAIGAGLLAGCGGSSNPSGGGGGEAEASPSPPPTAPALPADRPPRPACGLVTQAEIEAAVGARVGAGREEAQDGRSVCSFILATAADQRVSVVSTSSSGVRNAFDTARQAVDAPQPVNAGEQAFVTGGLALVRRGDTMVTILVALKRERPELASVATRLATSVGSHL